MTRTNIVDAKKLDFVTSREVIRYKKETSLKSNEPIFCVTNKIELLRVKSQSRYINW
jgi:hypothetical protein